MRWVALAVVCAGCVDLAELPPAELVLAEPHVAGFVLGEDSLDWSTLEQVDGGYRQTFHRREPLASAPRIIGSFTESPLIRGLLGRVGDALLIGTGGSYDWCQWYGLLAPGDVEPVHVPLPVTGVPEYEACWTRRLGWHDGRLIYVADFMRETPYGMYVEGDEVVAFDFDSREWGLLDDGPDIEWAVFDQGRLTVHWESAWSGGFRLEDLDGFDDRGITVDVRELMAMTSTRNAVIWTERPFAGVIAPLYRSTEGGTEVFVDLGTQVRELFTDGENVWAVADHDDGRDLVRITPDRDVTRYSFGWRRIVEHRPGALLLFDDEARELWLQPLPP